MMRRAAISAVAVLGLAPMLSLSASCTYDLAAMLALDESAFDQDLSGNGGGWRMLTNQAGCELAAADLIAAYRAAHPGVGPMLSWHEGQLRAFAGQYDRAIPLLKGSRTPAVEDRFGWNSYVDATVAFLKNDRAALEAARKLLSDVPYPGGADTPLVEGYLVIPAHGAQPEMRIRWPPNLDVVDGLIACFKKPYSEAYGASCRPK